jgi:hypothetical protein
VLSYSLQLNKKGLTPRKYNDQSGVQINAGRLTDLGLAFCNNIFEYEKDVLATME